MFGVVDTKYRRSRKRGEQKINRNRRAFSGEARKEPEEQETRPFVAAPSREGSGELSLSWT